MYILRYETSSKYLGFKRVHYKEFFDLIVLRYFIEENDIKHYQIYIRGVR